jgi:hypothetical protein
MNDMIYLMMAYAAFWGISFAFIYTIFSRQRKLDQEVQMLKQLLDKDV